MAEYSQSGTLAYKREQTDIYDIDKHYRFEITSTTTGVIVGAVFLRKDEVDAADHFPDTIAITHT